MKSTNTSCVIAYVSTRHRIAHAQRTRPDHDGCGQLPAAVKIQEGAGLLPRLPSRILKAREVGHCDRHVHARYEGNYVPHSQKRFALVEIVVPARRRSPWQFWVEPSFGLRCSLHTIYRCTPRERGTEVDLWEVGLVRVDHVLVHATYQGPAPNCGSPHPHRGGLFLVKENGVKPNTQYPAQNACTGPSKQEAGGEESHRQKLYFIYYFVLT
eukprot:1657975-Rhodomonas_salina.1